MKSYFRESAEKMDICINDSQLEKFQKFYDMLIEKNRVMNLTAITDEREVVQKHFLDSMAAMNYIFDGVCGEKVGMTGSVMDIGTGAGFPGIPLAIMCPDVNFTLADSLRKRIDFIQNVIEECGLDNVIAIHSRAEDLGRNDEYREKYDYVVSRAVANLAILLEYCIPFVKVGGEFISYKSSLADDEIACSETAQKKLGCEFYQKENYQIPNTDLTRNLLFFRKKEKLDGKYPRQPGKIKKNPL